MKQPELDEVVRNGGRGGVETEPEPEVVHVYYGEKSRWNNDLLEQIDAALGGTLMGFDGLQADFEFETPEKAMAAFLMVRGMGVGATYREMGKGPSPESVEKAIEVMKRAYAKKFPKGRS